ncbi:MAG: hypothetical protein DRP82_07715 [Planctomycetota bacterium]|nr:MAG: hypothetical protein DRP82_07715 [Planctomycetota bacterium]
MALVRPQEALIFDVDGVLVDTVESFHAAAIETVHRLSGWKPTLVHIMRLKEAGGFNDDVDVAMELLRQRGVAVAREQVETLFLEIYEGNPKGTGTVRRERPLVELRTLDVLKSHFPLAIFTGRLRRHMDSAANRFGLHHFFKVWVCLEDTPQDKRKPHPFGLLLALARLGVTKGAYVGDTPDDMRCAKAAGLAAIAVLPPYASNSYKKALIDAGADVVIDSVNRLPQILL